MICPKCGHKLSRQRIARELASVGGKRWAATMDPAALSDRMKQVRAAREAKRKEKPIV